VLGCKKSNCSSVFVYVYSLSSHLLQIIHVPSRAVRQTKAIFLLFCFGLFFVMRGVGGGGAGSSFLY